MVRRMILYLIFLLVFYCCYKKLIHWYLDQVPTVPELITPFKKHTNETTQRSVHPLRVGIPMPIGTATIIIERIMPNPAVLRQMLGAIF